VCAARGWQGKDVDHVGMTLDRQLHVPAFAKKVRGTLFRGRLERVVRTA
jgi:hypothetical protein